jgi:long-chain acyl-CoA synthetase
MSFNLATMLRESALSRPDKVAVILDQFRLDYKTVDALSNQVAGSLQAAGVRRGDRVGLMLPNVPQFVISYYGILKAGAVVVPMNVLLRAPEVAFYVGDSEARVLITWEDFAEEAMKGVSQLSGVTTYVVNKPGSEARPSGARPFTELMQGSPAFDMVATDADDTAVILYTSGTTGKPKGAELTHFNLFMCCQVSGDRLIEFKDDDVGLAVLPLFHSFGQSNVMNTTVYAGGTITLVPRFEADKVMEVIQRDRVTIFLGVPTMYFALLHSPRSGEYDLSTLRLCVSGGASMPGEVMKAFEQKFGATILEGYGLSETSPTASFNRSQAERKFLSIGKPIWGVEMRIHDENDQPAGPGQENVGEIVIRGHNVMKGYFKQPEATAEAMKNGWFHSGDMGYQDAEGFFFIVDRKKELIIRGGFNVYPREVEEVLYAHPAVQEAAVIGIPDPKMGEEVKAVVALKQGQSATEEELIAWTKERVAAYKYPRSVQFVDTLPKGPTGKILKKELKAKLETAKA